MRLSGLVEKAWRLCLLLGAFFLFLQFWGPPLWLSHFPQSSVYRLMNALYGDLMAALLVLTPRVLGAPRNLRNLSDVLAGMVLLVFSALVLTSRPLEEWDMALGLLAALVAVLGSVLAVSQLCRPLPTWSRFLPWVLVPAGPVVLGGLALDQGMPGLHTAVVGVWGACLLGAAVGLSLVPLAAVSPVSSPKARGNPLSQREWEVLDQLREGKTNQEIAEALFISLATVKSHLSHMQRKTGARNRVEILRILLSEDGKSAFQRMEAGELGDHAGSRRNP